MAKQRLNLTRDQLASFLNDFEQVKQFEKLFSTVDSIDTFTLDEISTSAATAGATANEALASISALSDLVAPLVAAPPPTGGTVTSVAASGGTTGLTFTGSPITTSGTLTLGGTLAVVNGGTGQTSYTDGQLLIGNSTGNTLTKATLIAGANVTITNGPGSITIAATGGGGGGGTVTSVSVVSANGLAGTVATATTTPAITLSTTVTGIVKGNGTALSAAIAGTDYVAPGAYTTSGLTMASSRLLGRTTAGTGAAEEISVAGGLTLTGGVLTGTSGTVTSVTGTAPVVSSGGSTPTISMAAASTSVSGYLTSTDWNTFNSKGSGSVTSVSGTGTVSGLTLTGTVTTTGSLTLGGTLSVTAANFSSQTANTFLAAPNGIAGVPTFRAIVAADVPTLNQNTTGTASNVTGTVAIANGGTGAITAPLARTALGATTVGSNVFTLTNPSAITFPRFNADNTVSALDAATFRTAIGAGTSSTTGTVTSVSGTGTVSGLTLTGTVTSSGSLTLGGTLAVTAANFASQTANTFLAAPNGAAGVPTFRAVVAADIPTLNQNTTGTASNVTGTVAIANGGTGAITAPLARTALGATTVGGNVFTLTNPSAITFPRFNADNTVSALDAATFRTAIGAGTSSTTGTVTSVAGTGSVNGITLTGTVTSSGSLTLGGTLSGVSLTSQVTGTLPVTNGGTGTATAFTTGSVVFANASGIYAQDNTNFFWDNTNKRLGIGTATPGSVLQLNKATGAVDMRLSIGGTLYGNIYASASDTTITSVTAIPLILGTDSTTRFQVGPVGQFGIGGATYGTAGQVLTSGGSLAAPTWATPTTGTVTSVSGTGTVSGLTLTGTVTTSGSLTLGGTLAVTASNFASQTANTFLAAPNGLAGVPTFRTVVAADIPTLNQNTTGTASNVTGTVAIANGGTGSTSTTYCSLTTNVTGTLPVGNGGTGATTFTANALLKGNTTSAVSASNVSDDGSTVSIASGKGFSVARTAVTAPAAADGNVFSGTYTPTAFNTTNVAASSPQSAQYMRVGNTVTVSGQIDIDPTIVGFTILGLSLPIASALTSAVQLSGVFNCPDAAGGGIYGDAANDRATFQMTATSAANLTYYYTFTYRVL